MEQTMRLSNINVPINILMIPTEKIFYKTFLYKLSFSVNPEDAVVELGYSAHMNKSYPYTLAIRAARRVRLNKIRNEILSIITTEEHRFRLEHTTVNFYTSNEQDVLILVEELSDILQAIHYPISNNHRDILSKSHTVRVRNSLFESKFKYKIYLKWGWTDRLDRFPEISNWLLSMGQDNTRWQPNSTLRDFMFTNKDARRLGSTIAFYLSDPEDIMMCHLKFDHLIEKVEEAVLISDLS